MNSGSNQSDDNISNLKTDDNISNLKTDIAVLKSELENIKQRDRWVQGILGALIVAILVKMLSVSTIEAIHSMLQLVK
jgi:hypothetical protein